MVPYGTDWGISDISNSYSDGSDMDVCCLIGIQLSLVFSRDIGYQAWYFYENKHNQYKIKSRNTLLTLTIEILLESKAYRDSLQ